MLDHKEIKARLKDVDPELCVAFAARCSLRALPMLVDTQGDELWYWNKGNRSKYILALFRAQHVSLNAFYSGRKNIHFTLSTLADASSSADRVIHASPSTYGINAYSALIASNVVASVTASVTASDADADAADAAASAATFASATTSSDINFDSEFLIDLDRILYFSNMDFPLWSAGIPSHFQLLYERFNDSLIALDEGFEIWVQWYKDKLDAVPIDRVLEGKWVNIPVEITEQGVKATNAYLSSLVIDQQLNSMKPLNLVRAIFLGNGAAGKTSLIRRLHNEPVLEGKEEMTPGIQIREWPVDLNSDIKARFWDFGGQVMSHSTHRIRIDCESEANHNLIRLLDKPDDYGVGFIISKYIDRPNDKS